RDLDNEGIWAELVYPSTGLWNSLITDPVLVREAVKVTNAWCAEVQREDRRHVMPAEVSHVDVFDAVAAVEQAAELDLKAVSLPCVTPSEVPDFNQRYWEPLWDALDAAGMVIACHTGAAGLEDP